MTDYRITTFVKLCETMNYRVTAEQLNITQPAVTQHIHYIEQYYHCKLFAYSGKKLSRTKEADLLLEYARSALYNEQELLQKIQAAGLPELRIGATKTIGEFILKDKIQKLVQSYPGNFTFIIDNTERLLGCLNQNELNFILLEGFFDKTKYGHTLFRSEPFVGICAASHPFAGQSIALSELFNETILIREPGSGTRAILEQFLFERNYLLSSFKRQVCISDFNLIKELAAAGEGISFVYESVVEKKDPLSTFTIQNCPIVRELNYIYLKNTKADQLIGLID